ncbi:competence type IV pilus minor pilin ComGD [Sporolactobacillus vineae]|uniref:competence type IV pilus minor pilin ComGD n=1 Tax=Sporolactobacillus vineae TaxID=444463 RepID=UPI0003766532
MSVPLNNASDQGFTLIELLIVVSIVCLITPVVFMNSSRTADEQKMRHFIEELDRTISEAQIESMSTLSTARIMFNTQDHYYQLIRSGTLMTRSMDRRMALYSTTGSYEITINPVGKFSQPKTLTFHIGTIHYRLVLLLGQGRHYYEKF